MPFLSLVDESRLHWRHVAFPHLAASGAGMMQQPSDRDKNRACRHKDKNGIGIQSDQPQYQDDAVSPVVSPKTNITTAQLFTVPANAIAFVCRPVNGDARVGDNDDLDGSGTGKATNSCYDGEQCSMTALSWMKFTLRPMPAHRSALPLSDGWRMSHERRASWQRNQDIRSDLRIRVASRFAF